MKSAQLPYRFKGYLIQQCLVTFWNLRITFFVVVIQLQNLKLCNVYGNHFETRQSMSTYLLLKCIITATSSKPKAKIRFLCTWVLKITISPKFFWRDIVGFQFEIKCINDSWVIWYTLNILTVPTASFAWRIRQIPFQTHKGM